MRNMLIVGGTGIVGKPLAELASQDYNVYVVAKDEGLGVISNTEFVKADRSNREEFRQIIQDITQSQASG